MDINNNISSLLKYCMVDCENTIIFHNPTDACNKNSFWIFKTAFLKISELSYA